MKLKFTIALIFVFQIIYSQTTEKENFWYRASFEMTSNLFKKSNNLYKIQKFEIDKILIKPTSNKADLLLAIDSLKQNGKLLLEDNRAKYLVFKSELPKAFRTEKLEVYSFNLSENNLVFENGSLLKLMRAESNSVGLNFSNRNQINFSENIEEKLTGTVSYRAKFISDYATNKISKKQIGTQIKLNNKEYFIVDIFDNKLVLKPLSTIVSGLESVNIKLIVLDETGENELVPFTYKEVEDLEKTNPKYKGTAIFSTSMNLVKENIYNEFRKGSEIGLEKFKSMTSFEELKDNSLTNKYIIFEYIAPLENEIILYEPIYGTSKTIEIKL